MWNKSKYFQKEKNRLKKQSLEYYLHTFVLKDYLKLITNKKISNRLLAAIYLSIIKFSHRCKLFT